MTQLLSPNPIIITTNTCTTMYPLNLNHCSQNRMPRYQRLNDDHTSTTTNTTKSSRVSRRQRRDDSDNRSLSSWAILDISQVVEMNDSAPAPFQRRNTVCLEAPERRRTKRGSGKTAKRRSSDPLISRMKPDIIEDLSNSTAEDVTHRRRRSVSVSEVSNDSSERDFCLSQLYQDYISEEVSEESS